MIEKEKLLQSSENAFATPAPAHPKTPFREGLWPYWIIYTVLCGVLFAEIALIFHSTGRAIVTTNGDGMQQFYNFFIYEGEWLRTALANLSQGQEIPLWEWDLGYGSDIFTSFDVITDPINLVSVFAAGDATQYVYEAMLFVRIYLAGAACSAYLLYRGMGRSASLAGTLVYTFSMSLLQGLYWPGYMVGPIMLPLMLLCIERIIDGKRPYLFILCSAQLFFSSYYFAYIICIFLVPYCAVRVIKSNPHIKALGFLAWAGRFLGYLAVGALIACLSLVPGIIALLGMSRVTDASAGQTGIYYLSYYANMIPAFVGRYKPGSDCRFGFGAVALIGCAALMMSRKQHRGLKAALVVMSVMFLLPVFGSILNGFNYASNRWVFVFAFFIAYVVALLVPRLTNLKRRDIIAVVAVIAFLAVWLVIFPQFRLIPPVVGLVCAGVILVLLVLPFGQRYRSCALMLGIIVCACSNIYLFCAYSQTEAVKYSISEGQMYSLLTDNQPADVVTQVDDEGFWRYDKDPGDGTTNNCTYSSLLNDNLALGLSGFDFYNSIYNGNIDAYHTELGLVGADTNYNYNNLGGRTILETLNATKYYLLPADKDITAPYNFRDTSKAVASGVENGGTYQVVEGSNTLSIGYAFANVITRSAYANLSTAGKQEALLQGVVLDDEDAAASDVAPATLSLQNSTVKSTVVATDGGLTLEDGVITVPRSGGTITLSIEGVANSETYLYFQGLNYYLRSPLERASSTWDQLSWSEKYQVFREQAYFWPTEVYSIYAAGDKGSAHRYISNHNSKSNMYGNKSTWMLNLGYSEQAQTTVTLTFPNMGTYYYDDLQVICQPMDSFDASIDKLQEDQLENVQIGTNTVSGTISLDSRKVLYLSIPYSQGWSATVDGQPAELLKADTAFCALVLDAGEHTVQLHYTTPGLTLGGWLSLVGLILLGGIVGRNEWVRRHARGVPKHASAEA